MNLSKDMQKVFTDEIHFVLRRMKDSDDAAKKLYFFSAVFGAAFRIMNIEFDPELAFIHHVLNNAYGTINARLASLAQGAERGITVPENLFGKLEEALEEMVARVERGEETYPVLQTIANLAYSTTGNGYYLYLKGLLPV